MYVEICIIIQIHKNKTPFIHIDMPSATMTTYATDGCVVVSLPSSLSAETCRSASSITLKSLPGVNE